MKKLFSEDKLTGIKKFWHVTDKGEYVLETVQQMDAILDQNKGEKLNKVATLPLSVYYQLKREGIADDPKRLAKWMNDPDNRAFRTRGGRL